MLDTRDALVSFGTLTDQIRTLTFMVYLNKQRKPMETLLLDPVSPKDRNPMPVVGPCQIP